MPELVNAKHAAEKCLKSAPACPHCGEEAPGLHIRCPKCSSMNIATGQKGFGLGKAAVGGLLLGPVGTAGRNARKKKI